MLKLRLGLQRLPILVNTMSIASKQTGKSSSVSITDKIIISRARYNGRKYYILSKNKHQIKLVFRKGSAVFTLKDTSAIQFLVIYKEPKSINCLKAFTRFIAHADAMLNNKGQIPQVA
jgi:hypothetical protein